MDIGTVLSVAQTLFASLQCSELKKMCSILGYKSELEDLQRVVSTVKAVLLDAEAKEVLNHEAKHWIQELKDAVYDADDLLDKFVTMIQQKKLIKCGKASKKLRRFFSHYNPLGIAYNMSQGIKKIRKKLDDVAKTHAQFGFTIDPQPIKVRREETCSYVYEAHIIGREHHVEKIVCHLLNDSRKDISFLAIVGIGGLGKTALAQLVYNDARIKSAFSSMIWTCISDYNQEKLDVEQIFRKIVDAKDERFTMESLQSEVRKKLAGKRYLLVLDDVWTENRNHWLNFEEFLQGGQHGSWVLLTTRSHKTASIVGNGRIIHKLDGLSKDKSWCLFKKIAFGSEQLNPSEELVEIGQRIVKGCAGVPLAIRVAGSLLYMRDKSNWLSFEKTGLCNFQESQIDIMPILKLSYHQLESQVKNCFTYCALFPKDYEIDVFLLKRLWMAQGYVVPLDDGRSMEAIADDYFFILLQRCFFQDVQYDSASEIISCKIHDLMHDIAEEVAGREICAPDFVTSDAGRKARHIAYTFNELPKISFSKTRLRSCLYVGPHVINTDSLINLSTSTSKELLAHWMGLRVLDLKYSGIKCLPESVGALLHLRYLDISFNSNLEVLPKSLVKLYNLQTLLIGGCKKLKELPKDFIKLVNLRTLLIKKCGIKYLACLGTLPQLKFLGLYKLYELEYIDEIKGEVGGSIRVSMRNGKLMIAHGLLSFPCLKELELCGLRKLKGWGNSRPEIAQVNSSSMTPMLLPQLKTLVIESCTDMKCKLLLPKLEVLYLYMFNESLEINRLNKETREVKVEEKSSSSTSGSTTSSSSCCCYGLPKLKKVYITHNVTWLNRMPLDSFHCLETLRISWDNQIESLGEVGEVFRSCSFSLVSLKVESCSKLRRVISGGLGYLSALENLQIRWCEVVSLSEEEERKDDGMIGIGLSCPRFLHSLRRLSLDGLPKLVNLPTWVHYMSALETLEIIHCNGLETMPDWIANIPFINIISHEKSDHI